MFQVGERKQAARGHPAVKHLPGYGQKCLCFLLTSLVLNSENISVSENDFLSDYSGIQLSRRFVLHLYRLFYFIRDTEFSLSSAQSQERTDPAFGDIDYFLLQ